MFQTEQDKMNHVHQLIEFTEIHAPKNMGALNKQQISYNMKIKKLQEQNANKNNMDQINEVQESNEHSYLSNQMQRSSR